MRTVRPVAISIALMLYAAAAGAQGHPATTVYAPANARHGGIISSTAGGGMELVPLNRRKLETAKVSVDGAALRLGIDYVPFDPGLLVRSVQNARVIYGGILEDTLQQITEDQAAGRVVVFTTRAPGAMTIAIAPHSRWSGAAAVMTINSDAGFDQVKSVGGLTSMVIWPERSADGSAPISLAITHAAATKLFGRAVDGLEVGALGGFVDAAFVYRSENRM
jgi:hypothetical protein